MKSILACCKLYISESRNALSLESIEQAVKRYPEAVIVNRFTDEVYNRVGYTIVSRLSVQTGVDADPLRKAVFDMVREAFRTIDLRQHTGTHPRLGVVDHICFHPLSLASLDQVAGIAKSLAVDIGQKLEVPTFLYGAAHKEGRTLDCIRRDLGYFKPNSSGNQWVGSLEFQKLHLKPDEGPDTVDQGKGVVVIGATRWVDNYNVPIQSNDITAVRRIARLVSGRGGGLESVQAMALVHSEDSIEVTCNLLEPNKVGANQVQCKVEELAAKEGLIVGKGYFTDFSQETRLDHMNLKMSPALVGKVLVGLNSHGTSALRFFNWVVQMESGFRADSRIHNLIIDNLGRLGDYGRMLVLLRELSRGGHCLTEQAFKFLTFCSSVTAEDSVKRVVEVLNMAGGSCRGSGIYSLIKFLCDLGSFELAVFVMEQTARKTSYYNVLIAAKCRSGDFQGAYDLFDEMRRWGCDPSTKSYNYLLGSLFKNDKVAEACELLESMEELGYHPDSVTFEVVIFHACRVKRMDFAIELLTRMLSDGIDLRFTTHAAFIKGFFWAGRVADAQKYVVNMNEWDKCSANMNYSLLASLSWKSGRVIEAGAFLFEMMEKNLKPNFSVYVKVIKALYKLGRGDLASDLKHRFSKFHRST